ncbi:MAG: Ku protein [Candidatus Aenigmarchaeota archaeon]|nr:Ku protein [Candidatus Aenigmarchaeota archaeon]
MRNIRVLWKGSISFSLVSIPVAIYTATEPKEIEFHNLCNVCHTPLKYLRWCPTCKKEVAWQDIKKGFKISKERWIILEKEEIERIKLPSIKTIDIQSFIDISQIDPIYFEKAYYVVPQETGIKPYSLFVEALRLANKAAIAKVVLKNKEYLVCLRPFRKGLCMHLLYFIREIRDVEELPELKGLVVVSKEELELAKALISKLTEEEFDPNKFKDRYSEALEELIKAKAEGKEFKVEKEKPVEEAKNLMESLKASIETVKKKKAE